MKLLAFDTSTEALSVAVTAGPEAAPLLFSGPGGALASATLIPELLRLLEQAGLTLPALDAIVFGCGPGSFTGLRTACAVAQGLAFGASVPVLPVDTLMAVAEEARACCGATQVQAVLDARMDEIYAADYRFDGALWQQQGDFQLLKPEQWQPRAGWVAAGNAFAACGERLAAGGGPRVEALPTAAAMLRLAPALLAAGRAVPASEALPRYIRDKVAKTTEERAAERAQPAP